MIRATQVLGQHRWTQSAADTVVLDFDDRHRRRMAMTGTRGLEFLLSFNNGAQAERFRRSIRKSFSQLKAVTSERGPKFVVFHTRPADINRRPTL